MRNNRKLHISIGGSRRAMTWTETEILWSSFIKRLQNPVRSTESLEEYMAFPKSKQDELKDVGGFVGGTLSDGRRKAANVTGRDLITLDLDNIKPGGTEDILKRVSGLGCTFCCYSTRKHVEYAPRIRVIIPLDRTAQPDEYEPAARKLAELIGIENCDPTTFEASRLMYWPSCSSDSQYLCDYADAPFCSLDGVLQMYTDWHEVTQWPQVPGTEVIDRRRAARQEDPTQKKGVIGAFCRAYTVTQALEHFIPGMYEPTAIPGRYTYTGGSTVGGAVIYDNDLFLFSHHATDPCSGQLVNAFDLIRLHMYGDRDREVKPDTPVNKTPSFLAMSRLAIDDPDVSALLARERQEEARQAFAESGVNNAHQEPPEEDIDWLKGLSVDGNGNYKKTINNIIMVLQHDPQVCGRIATDEFAGCGVVLGSLPWNQEEDRRRWREADDSGFAWYMETRYGITGRDKLTDALTIIGAQHQINAVRDYLKSLKWDGKKRIERLLPDYLGADDDAYTRSVMKKLLCAAVARAVTGGVKFDYMPILTGPQGIGKSTFLSILGGQWYSDSLTTFEGKEAAELIQGIWINEVGELTAMSRQEINAVKQFLSKTDDIYRAAYGRRTEKYPRRGVFCGTSNDAEFLKDNTGNRRFWPVDVGVNPISRSIWEELPEERDQIWAEAYAYWMLGEPLYLSKEVEAMAEKHQEEHREASAKEGIIQEFLDRPVPLNWDSMSLQSRRMYLAGSMHIADAETRLRDKVCAAEIWVECFGGNPGYMRKADGAEISGAMIRMPGWKRNKSVRRYGPYGTQRGFERT